MNSKRIGESFLCLPRLAVRPTESTCVILPVYLIQYCREAREEIIGNWDPSQGWIYAFDFYTSQQYTKDIVKQSFIIYKIKFIAFSTEFFC